MIISLTALFLADYFYDKQIGQYLKLADDASTAQIKLQYFYQYRDLASQISRNDAYFIFKQKQYTRDEQLKILDTLIIRLEDATNMDPQSFEYQQAMYQISGQEFNHTLERINSIFFNAWLRSGMISYWVIWNWLVVILLWIYPIIRFIKFMIEI